MSKMKKSVLFCLMACCFLFLFSGCNLIKDVKETVKAGAGEDITVIDDEEKAVPEETEPEEEILEEPEIRVGTDGPVLGQKDIEDYDGYTYLYCEQLRTDSTQNEETGKMENKELAVFIPVSDYNYVDRSSISGEKLGVRFDIDLEPYIRYDEEDYLMAENLQYYIDSQYDPFYSTDYKDLVISEVEEIGSSAVRVTVEYCNYDKYSDNYTPVFATYYLAELEDAVTVLVCMEVNAEEATGKTPQMIEELESFYQFEIDWDADRAQQKLEDYLASGGDTTFSTGYVMFELPEGWREDTSNSDYSTDLYAPGGNADSAGCGLALYEEYLGYETVDPDILENNPDALIQIVEGYLTESAVDVKVSYYGKTCLGVAVKCEMEMPVDDDDEMAQVHMYYVFNESYMYLVTAMKYSDIDEDPFAVAEDILQNGTVPVY